MALELSRHWFKQRLVACTSQKHHPNQWCSGIVVSMQWPLQPRACHLGLCFLHNFSGMKRTCWTTGSWRCCLSLEVVSSIPAGSTIIYWFLCGFICVSLCQSINIKPTNMYIASARAQFKINTRGCWNWHLSIPDGLSVVQCSLRYFIGIVFFDKISVA